MQRVVSEQLRSAAETAVVDGLGFLQADVEPNGAWSLEWRRPTGPAEDPKPPWLAGLGILALEICDHHQAADILSRSRDFLVSRIESPGLWRWPPHPPDVDSTAICALAVGPHRHPWLFFGRNVRRILSCRDDNGRFLLWMGPLGPFGIPDYNDDDPVTNVNAVAYLGGRAETRPAQRWIESLITEDRVSGSSKWYSSMDLYYTVSRATRVAAPVFERLRPTLASRIPSERLDTAVAVAQAVSALDMLGEITQVEFLRRCAVRLIDMQHADGGWPACEVCRAPGGVRIYLSRALTTAYCVEALTRLTRP